MAEQRRPQIIGAASRTARDELELNQCFSLVILMHDNDVPLISEVDDDFYLVFAMVK